MKLTTPYPFLI